MRALKYWLIYHTLCPLAVWFLRLYRRLVGFRVLNWDNEIQTRGEGPGIYVMFHCDLLYCAMFLMEAHERGLTCTIELSASRDGEIAARILGKLGLRITRGSAVKRRRIAGVRGLLRELKEGRSVGIALDGPRGPRGKISPAILSIAQRTGCPLAPHYGRATREWRLPTWDRFRIPKPFRRAEGVFLEPLYVPKDADEATLERIRKRLREQMEIGD